MAATGDYSGASLFDTPATTKDVGVAAIDAFRALSRFTSAQSSLDICSTKVITPLLPKPSDNTKYAAPSSSSTTSISKSGASRGAYCMGRFGVLIVLGIWRRWGF
ncbi:unnamed protein product [Peniophora sp. CBMAI 1063]|nr:unnamed protein product [Peniophora sp. CBMAI 1063]